MSDQDQPNQHRRRVLVVDDDEAIRNLCRAIVASAGLEPVCAADGLEASNLIARLHPECVLLDVNLPGRSGMDLLREIRLRYPNIRVIMITGYAAVDLAVEAMKLGADDYIPKPFTTQRLLSVLGAARPKPAPTSPTAPTRTAFCDMVGLSSAMQATYDLIEKAARTDSTVLIEGESGTGKELAARAIHACSRRAKEPFLPVNCGAIPPTLIESELFGHRVGAFTDARANREGILRAARGGTVFLDEIAELPADIQVKLLRALQEMEVRPVGANVAEPFQARIIAATNRDLTQEVSRGAFRRDLFYRLHVVPIFLPPLRERREDIPVLIEHFLHHYGKRHGRRMTISPGALRHLIRYDWPGNVRELENAIQRAFALLDGDTIRLDDMPTLFPRQAIGKSVITATPSPESVPAQGNLLARQEAEAIRTALRQASGNKRDAARILGIGVATLYRKIKKYEIVSF